MVYLIKQNDNKNINLFYKIIIFMNFLVATNSTLYDNRILRWSSIALTVIALIVYVMFNRIKTTPYLLWLYLFGLIVITSTFWSYEMSYAVQGIKGMIITFSIFILLSLLVQDKEAFYLVLKIFIVTQLINAIYILLFIDLSSLGEIRIGGDTLGEEWNANKIGMLMAFASFVSIVIMNISKNIKVKMIYISFIALFGFITFMTGSKKGLFVLIFTVLV